MAAFQKPGFVVAVIHNGQIIREMSEGGERVVRLPFNSEYSIRLINKTNKRAYASIKIDGTSILAGKLVLGANDKIDVERFMLDGDTSVGKRLKFVSSTESSDVQDPTSPDNGLLEVVFEPEVQDYLKAAPAVLRGMSFGSGSGGVINTSYCAANSASASAASNIPDDIGATVGGSASNQGFQYTNTFFLTDAPVRISLQLKGPKSQPVLGYGTSRKPYVVTNQGGSPVIDVNGTIIGGLDGIEITGTHLVLKIPMSQVQLGWPK